VLEDEACGSATLVLAVALGRAVVVRHGRGSLVRARPAGPGLGEVGGLVAYDRALVVDVSSDPGARYNGPQSAKSTEHP
jgi:hypothetical protein